MKFCAASIMFLFGTTCCWITPQMLGVAFDEIFGQQNNLRSSIINLIFGYMLLFNGCLDNIGHYSSELKAAYDDEGKRDYLSDTSDDSLTSLVLQLFSFDGASNIIRQSESSFTTKYFIGNEAYDAKNPAVKDREKNIRMLGETFIRLLRGETFTEEAMTENPGVLTPFELFEKYVFTPSKALGLSSTKLKLLVIHAYVLNLLENFEDFKIYLEAICVGLQRFEDTEHLQALSADQKKLFETFYKYDCLGFPYSQFKLPEPNSLIPVYIRENEEFSDRNLIILLYLCNCLFYNDATRKCSLEHLRPRNGEISPEFDLLYKFYDKNEFAPFELTKDMRKDWYLMMLGLSDITNTDNGDSKSIHKIYFEGRLGHSCDLVPGIKNFMRVLAKICNAEKSFLEITKYDDINDAEFLLQNFCNFLRKISLKNPNVLNVFDNLSNFSYFIDKDFKVKVNDLVGYFEIKMDYTYIWL